PPQPYPTLFPYTTLFRSAFELLETQIDPPLYKDYRGYEVALAEVEAKLHRIDGGYVALAGGQVAGAILLNVQDWRSVAQIEDLRSEEHTSELQSLAYLVC